MNFDPGISVIADRQSLTFSYGEGCFGPPTEKRKLDDIRKSLRDPSCNGPDTVYGIAMDVGKNMHKALLQEQMLLFGVVIYATGRLGKEPVRSQGHIHKISSHSGWSPPEVYEIWSGNAIIYMQESADDDPGRCFAVHAGPGDVVVVPPGWAHATINANPETHLVFGAWCDREYGFLYEPVRARKGLAWYPLLNDQGEINWLPNQHYKTSPLTEKTPRDYSTIFGIEKGTPIYIQFENDPDRFQFVSKPRLKKEVWEHYEP